MNFSFSYTNYTKTVFVSLDERLAVRIHTVRRYPYSLEGFVAPGRKFFNLIKRMGLMVLYGF